MVLQSATHMDGTDALGSGLPGLDSFQKGNNLGISKEMEKEGGREQITLATYILVNK